MRTRSNERSSLRLPGRDGQRLSPQNRPGALPRSHGELRTGPPSGAFRTPWLLEVHFSDYYPTPEPALLWRYIAAPFPTSRSDLGAGVGPLPLVHPLRLAEEIAQLDGMDAGGTRISHSARHCQDGVRRLQRRHERGPRAIRGFVSIVEKWTFGASPYPLTVRFWKISGRSPSGPTGGQGRRKKSASRRTPAGRQCEVMGDLERGAICAYRPYDKLLGNNTFPLAGRAGAAATPRTRSFRSRKMFIADTDEESARARPAILPALFDLQCTTTSPTPIRGHDIPEYRISAACAANLRKTHPTPPSWPTFMDSLKHGRGSGHDSGRIDQLAALALQLLHGCSWTTPRPRRLELASA